jgi:hypothetical protein
MHNFIMHFKRDATGVWVCVESATLDLPQGRIQVAPDTRFTLGTTFMNVDIALMLEVEYERRTRFMAS